MSKIQGGMGSIEKRLEALEKGAQARGWEPRGTEARRRQTLVFGGWDRDTKREKVLRELQEAIEGLGLEQLVSEEAFTTGPRKSVALMNFPLKANETDEDRRNRMHEMVLSVSKANARTSAGKRLWCSYSRTKEQRDVSSHCGWLKRALGSIDADWARELDVEYATGSVWLGNSLVASSVREADASTPEDRMMWNTRGFTRAWVDIGKLALETNIAVDDLRMALNDTKK